MSAVDPWGKLFWTDKTVRLDLFWRKRSGEKGILMSNQTAGINHKPVTIGIEREYSVSSAGQLRTRFQAFIESLEIKNIQGGKK